MDVEGNILVRDMRNINDVLAHIKMGRGYESGEILFNSKMKNDLFVCYNNVVEIYDTDGRVIQSREFDYNVTHAVQDEDSLVLSYQNNTLACYDWSQDKVVDELEAFAEGMDIKAMTIHGQVVACGGEAGEINILQHK